MEEKIEKEMRVVEAFKKNPNLSIESLSKLTGISASSVQRYLKNHSFEKIEKEEKTIEEKLKQNRREGNRLGGLNSFLKNDFIKDDNGHFIGSKKTTSKENKELKKQRDILIVCKTYLENPTLTLEELAKSTNMTKDYVYDCLKDNRLDDLIGEELIGRIEENLSSKGRLNR